MSRAYINYGRLVEVVKNIKWLRVSINLIFVKCALCASFQLSVVLFLVWHNNKVYQVSIYFAALYSPLTHTPYVEYKFIKRLTKLKPTAESVGVRPFATLPVDRVDNSTPNPHSIASNHHPSHIRKVLCKFSVSFVEIVMRQGCYELLVINSDGSVFPECTLEGKTFIRVAPGQDYAVKFIVHRDASGGYPFSHVICFLTVDGHETDRGVYLNLNLDSSSNSKCAFFRGFRVDSETVQVLKFSDVTLSSDLALCEASSKAGLLQVTVFEAERFAKPVNANSAYVPPPVAPVLNAVLEDKKFWKVPSVATIRGGNLEQLYNPVNFRKMRQLPDATLEVQCHTAGVLDYLHDQREKFNTRSSPVGVQIDLMTVPLPGQTLLVDLTGKSATVTVMEPAPVPPAEEADQKQQLLEQNELEESTTAEVGENINTSRTTDIPRTDHMQDEEVQAQVEAEESAQKMYKRKGQVKDEGMEQWVLVTVVHERPTKKAKKARKVGGADGTING